MSQVTRLLLVRHAQPPEEAHGRYYGLADCLSMPDEAIFRLDQSYGALSIIDWIDSTPIVRLLNAQPTMVAAKRRGFLPAFAEPQPVGRVAP